MMTMRPKLYADGNAWGPHIARLVTMVVAISTVFFSPSPLTRQLRRESFSTFSNSPTWRASGTALPSLLKFRGGRKLPLQPDDYSENDYDAWWERTEIEFDYAKKGELVDGEMTEAQFQAARPARNARLEKEELDRTPYPMDESYKNRPFPKEILDPDIRPVYKPEEIPKDEDGWTREMWIAFEYGLRKYGTRWTNVLRSKKGRYFLRFLDESDLIGKWRKEKAKNHDWGKWPNFYYYKGSQGKVRKPSRNKTKPLQYILGAVRPEKYRKPAPPPLPPSGYRGVYYSNQRQGWFGEFKYYQGGGDPQGRGGHSKTGHIKWQRTEIHEKAQDAYDELQQMREEWGLKAADEFEEAVEKLGYQPDIISGKARVKLHDWMYKAGFINRTVMHKWLITPLPLRLDLAKFMQPQQVARRTAPRKDKTCV
mmetsp:Transcript_31039/g.75694  ORF Transcript_31039/g.75694 Transcript_31039/m.75694 type:complete len:424 (+) Transcript_31039:306-1577(+)